MPEVLEIEKIKNDKAEKTEPEWDSWIVDIPPEIVKAQGLDDDAMVVLTIKDEKVEAEILPPLSEELKNISDEIFERRKKLYERFEQTGD
jgi:hypothetical protein